jgi:hypothetical protein
MKVGARSVVWWPTDEQHGRDGSAEPLLELVGLFGANEEAAAEQARERSRKWREEFDRQLMSAVEEPEPDADGDAGGRTTRHRDSSSWRVRRANPQRTRSSA